MSAAHLQPRHPKRKSGFCWSRAPTHSPAFVTGVTWCLFRRDCHGSTHAEIRLFPVETDRRDIARHLRVMRRKLRGRVDDIELRAMESEAA